MWCQAERDPNSAINIERRGKIRCLVRFAQERGAQMKPEGERDEGLQSSEQKSRSRVYEKSGRLARALFAFQGRGELGIAAARAHRSSPNGPHAPHRLLSDS